MIYLKTASQIEAMKEGGKILREVVSELLPYIREGVTTAQIDKRATDLIRQNKAEPAFKKVKGYEWSTCLPINEEIVHTPPSPRVLKNGDVLTLDIGVFYKGLNTDYADTLIVGDVKDPEIEKFLNIGRNALEKAIQKARAGHFLGEISKTIQEEISTSGYFVIKELTGHGIGTKLHEEPYVPGFLDRPIEKTYRMQEGLVIAVEIIYSMGTQNIAYSKDNDWTIKTADGSMSACFEKTIAITSKNPFVLT